MEEKLTDEKKIEKDSKTTNLANEFMESKTFQNFFPNQIITYRSFKFPKVTIQTVPEKDHLKYIQNQSSKDIMIIEYNVLVNFINDPDYIGPSEDASCLKVINKNDPFTLTIKSNVVNPGIKLDDNIELEYLDNFKEVFLKLIQLILENLDEEDIKKLNEDN
jgi:hypothetical protein